MADNNKPLDFPDAHEQAVMLRRNSGPTANLARCYLEREAMLIEARQLLRDFADREEARLGATGVDPRRLPLISDTRHWLARLSTEGK